MALSRIGASADFTVLFTKPAYAATSMRHGRQNLDQLHASVIRRYPEAPQLPLPSNVSEIFNIETSRFAPERVRDLATPVFLHNRTAYDKSSGFESYGFDSSARTRQLDSHVDSYDCFGAISLSGTMQTNVPKPFCSSGKSTYLNMPGGQWARDDKYIAEDMRKTSFTMYHLRNIKRSGGFDGLTSRSRIRDVVRCYSTGATSTTEPKLTAEKIEAQRKKIMAVKKQRFKIILRDYGKTVIVFHVGISLLTLGICYSLVSNGIDMTGVINFFSKEIPENEENEMMKDIMSESSTFLIAYGIHKLFAPIRISCTCAFTPIIVRYLRHKGILKPPAKVAPTK